MSKRTRGAIAMTMGIIAFVGGFAAAGSVFGIDIRGEMQYGATGAFLAGSIAAGCIVTVALLLVVMWAVLEWVFRGDDS